MAKNGFIGFRADEAERQRVLHLARLAGMSTSELMRALLASAELQKIERLQPVARLSREQVH